MEIEVPTAQEDVDQLWSASRAALRVPLRCLCSKPSPFGHHRQCQGQDPRHTRLARLARLCSKPSPSDTVDNVKAKIQGHARLARLCSKPSPSDTVDNVKAKIQDTPVLPISAANPHLRTPSTTSRPRFKTRIAAHLTRLSHLRTPSTTSRPRSKTQIPACLAISGGRFSSFFTDTFIKRYSTFRVDFGSTLYTTGSNFISHHCNATSDTTNPFVAPSRSYTWLDSLDLQQCTYTNYWPRI
jgi:hypothetical protein